MSETPAHKEIKELLQVKLGQWFGASISEYPSSGHELDVYALTPEGVSIYIEIIWTHAITHFLQDMNILQQSDADVKLVIGSHEIVNDAKMQREFTKVAISQTKLGKCIYDEILDGNTILSDKGYVERKLHAILTDLVENASKRRMPQEQARVDRILQPLRDLRAKLHLLMSDYNSKNYAHFFSDLKQVCKLIDEMHTYGLDIDIDEELPAKVSIDLEKLRQKYEESRKKYEQELSKIKDDDVESRNRLFDQYRTQLLNDEEIVRVAFDLLTELEIWLREHV